MECPCIFQTEKIKCQSNKTWTFNGIICKHHLNKIYGLDLKYYTFTTDSEVMVVGPFLIAVENFKFKDKEVVLPTREYFDKIYRPDLNALNDSEVDYKLNSKMQLYIQELGIHAKADNKSAYRYQMEMIRNISVPKVENVNLGNDIHKDSFKNFLVTLKTRMSGLNQTIDSTKVKELFKNIQIVDMATGDLVNITHENTFSDFYQFLLSYCLYDVHKPPLTNVMAETISYNLIYKPGIGFVATESIPNPIPLVVAGDQVGNQLQYYTSTATYTKESKNITIDPKRYPDNRTVLGSLTGASNDCIY